MTTTIPVYAQFVGADDTTPVVGSPDVDNPLSPELGSRLSDALTTLSAGLVTLLTTNMSADWSTPGQVTLSIPQAVSTTSDVKFRALGGGGSAPTIASGDLGTGAGSSPTTTITGNSIVFRFDCTTGSSPAANSTIARFTFDHTFSNAPLVLMIPANGISWAAQSTTAQAVRVPNGNITTTTFILQSGSSSALAASTAYSWYFIILRA